MGRFDSLTTLDNQPSTAPVAPEPKASAPKKPPVRQQAAAKVYKGDPSPSPYPPPQTRRKIKDRHPFDIYEDQYASLTRIAKEERAQGLPGSMNRMVREGIDMYLAARKSGKK